MTIAWLLYAALLALWLACAAAIAERALRLLGREARLVWAGAMLLAIAAPAVLLVLRVIGVEIVQLPPIVIGTGTSPLGSSLDSFAASATRARSVGAIVVALWAVATASSLALLARATLVIGARRCEWIAQQIDDTPVLVADDTGPAVVGVRRPAIVVPGWVLELEAPLRRLVLLHEREHLQRGDSRLLFASSLVAALVPWNPVLWWMRRRLRSAIELDCDARVLRQHPDPRRYGALLLLVGQRAVPAGMTMTALIEPTSILVRRIQSMSAIRPRHAGLRAAALGILTVLLLAAACETPTPATPVELPPLAAQPPATAATRAPSSSPLVASATTMSPRSDIPLAWYARPPRGDNAADVVRRARAHAVAPTVISPNGAYFEYQVERPARMDPGSAVPRYPDALRQAGVEGVVEAQFVVDTAGRVEPGTVRILRANHDLFEKAILNALPAMKFVAAQVGGRPVRQVVNAPFAFSIPK